MGKKIALYQLNSQKNFFQDYFKGEIDIAIQERD